VCVESDTNAWSVYGGRWRSVRISYPRYWPPGWGVEPLLALAVGIAVAVGSALFLYFVGDRCSRRACSGRRRCQRRARGDPRRRSGDHGHVRLAYGERGDGADPPAAFLR
jgi:hypothetical protein